MVGTGLWWTAYARGTGAVLAWSDVVADQQRSFGSTDMVIGVVGHTMTGAPLYAAKVPSTEESQIMCDALQTGPDSYMKPFEG